MISTLPSHHFLSSLAIIQEVLPFISSRAISKQYQLYQKSISMASSLPISYEYRVVLKHGAKLLLPSVHPRHLPPAESRCDSCSTIWGEKPNDEDYIEYPFVMIPCQHIVSSAVSKILFLESSPIPTSLGVVRHALGALTSELCLISLTLALVSKC